MKKILVLFAVTTILPLSSMAYINENETNSIEVLRAQGYSESSLQLADWTNANNRGKNSKYVRYYKHKKNGFLGRAYQNLKTYVDPIQDDGMFAEHQIEFSNTWQGNATKYSSDMEPSGQEQIENL